MNPNPILRPRITEKATDLAESPKRTRATYSFEVHPAATKVTVARAVKEVYKVAPVAVRMVRLPSKVVMGRGGLGRSGGVKKAYVTLKKGEKIEAL